MKTFTIQTEIQCTKTIEYMVEADSLEEAVEKIAWGEERGNGIEIISKEVNDWGTEIIIDTEDEDK